jgi:hypothetical protein
VASASAAGSGTIVFQGNLLTMGADEGGNIQPGWGR